MFYSVVLLPEHRGWSAGASGPTQKTAPSAGDNSDLQYFPGFALRPALPSHTVNHLAFFPSDIWVCNIYFPKAGIKVDNLFSA